MISFRRSRAIADKTCVYDGVWTAVYTVVINLCFDEVGSNRSISDFGRCAIL